MQLYMIMPVGSDALFSEKRAIIESESQKGHCKAYFPLEEISDGDFDLNSTLQSLRDSQFVIADLSLERPSCYFELGLAQAIGKLTLLVAEQGTLIHQATGRNQTRFYRNLDEYRRIISEILLETRSHQIFKTA